MRSVKVLYVGIGFTVCGRRHSHFLFKAGTEVILIGISYPGAYFFQGCGRSTELLAGRINADICNDIGNIFFFCFFK